MFGEYVAQIARVLDDSEVRQQLSLVGRERMLTHHSWKIAMEKMDANLMGNNANDSEFGNINMQENHI